MPAADPVRTVCGKHRHTRTCHQRRSTGPGHGHHAASEPDRRA
ncbi:MAG: hypothetical protein AVDCRST_MAG66-1150 [uncultured Pseudonocardia sp.]|uniref:Uncharacterized protein n=1 Tax=uncultured Pseudonocardia sp. TaxID=211455 RepID=A0A6J4NS84_9PSEU|nr:MAG: hypothetical protein AVDCRST_MAG66-1150 [uncultured Pseudonocardia sp.]